jgi:serine protease Do
MTPFFRKIVPAVVGALLACSAPSANAQSVPQPPPGQTVKPSGQPLINLPSLAPLVKAVQDGVVNVEVTSRGHHSERIGGGEEGQAPNDFFHQFGNPFGNPFGQEPPHQQIQQGLGSGFFIDGRGYILTNNHVVEGAIAIDVHLHDGRTLAATVVGRDPATDVALIKIKGKVPQNLPILKLGDSDQMQVGDWVMAIGNPFGLPSSASLGIISAKARDIGATTYDDFFQTDAAINPGNSGGPLFNLKGEVIGMNTAIVSGASGIGFAVPSNLAKAIVDQIEKHGKVIRSWLGVGVQPLTPDLAKALKVPSDHGAVVTQVTPNTPAAKAGLKPEDVITGLEGQKVDSSRDLSRSISLMPPGKTVTLEVYRGGKQTNIKVTLANRPADLDGNQGDEDLGPGGEDRSNKQRIGLTFQDLDQQTARMLGMRQTTGALISEVVPGSPADRSGLSRGMVVVEANHQPVRSAQQLSRILKSARSGQTVLLRVALPRGSGTLLRALTIP